MIERLFRRLARGFGRLFGESPVFRKIVARNFLYTFLCIVLPVTTIFGALQFAQSRQRQDAMLVENRHIARQCVTELESIWARMQSNAMQLSSSAMVQALMRTDRQTLSPRMLSRLEKVQQLLKTVIGNGEDTAFAALFFAQPQYFISNRGASRQSGDEAPRVMNIPEILFKPMILSFFLSGEAEAYSLNAGYLYCFSRFATIEGQKGATLVCLNMTYVQARIDNYLSENQYIVWMDKEGSAYLDSRSPLKDRMAVDALIPGLTRETEGLVQNEERTETITWEQSAQNPWQIVLVSDASEYARQLRRGYGASAALAIGVIALCALAALLIAKRISKPYLVIMDLLTSPAQDAIDRYRRDYARVDDFGMIYALIGQTKYQVLAAQDELATRESLLKSAQSIALQSQINPHFLYNTLDSINWRVRSQVPEPNEISEMICDLSMLFQLSLHTDSMLIFLRDEIAHGELYLKIMNRRTRGSFQVVWEVPPEYEEELVVRLTLQPLLENAISYGIKKLSGNGVIIIRCEGDDDVLRLSVSDNGPGMSAETLWQIEERLKGSPFQMEEHIGLFNVHQRLQLSFGEEYGLTLRSEPFVETRVTMIMPRRTT